MSNIYEQVMQKPFFTGKNKSDNILVKYNKGLFLRVFQPKSFCETIFSFHKLQDNKTEKE